MATEANLTMREDNDETITFTISPASAADDLTGVASVEVVLKSDVCVDDDSTYALVLTSADPTEVLLVTQTPTSITGEAYVPASYLAEPYDRVYRVDLLNASGERRTAVYGAITVTDL